MSWKWKTFIDQNVFGSKHNRNRLKAKVSENWKHGLDKCAVRRLVIPVDPQDPDELLRFWMDDRDIIVSMPNASLKIFSLDDFSLTTSLDVKRDHDLIVAMNEDLIMVASDQETEILVFDRSTNKIVNRFYNSLFEHLIAANEGFFVTTAPTDDKDETDVIEVFTIVMRKSDEMSQSR